MRVIILLVLSTILSCSSLSNSSYIDKYLSINSISNSNLVVPILGEEGNRVLEEVFSNRQFNLLAYLIPKYISHKSDGEDVEHIYVEYPWGGYYGVMLPPFQWWEGYVPPSEKYRVVISDEATKSLPVFITTWFHEMEHVRQWKEDMDETDFRAPGGSDLRELKSYYAEYILRHLTGVEKNAPEELRYIIWSVKSHYRDMVLADRDGQLRNLLPVGLFVDFPELKEING